MINKDEYRKPILEKHVNKISREGKYTEDEEVSSLLLFLRGPGVSGDL